MTHEEPKDQDTIVIELGQVLTEEQYNEVVKSVITFMNKRWPDLTKTRFTN